MDTVHKRAFRTFVVSLAIACVVSSCAVVNPYRRGDDKAYQTDASLKNAVTFAEDTRNEYYDAISEQTLLNRTVGVALVGAAAAAAFLGITGGSTDVITGLGVGGAGLFVADSLLYSRPRLGIYVAGAKAISCTLSIYAPIRALDTAHLTARLDELLRKLPGEASELEGLIRGVLPESSANSIVSDANHVLDAAKTTITRGHKARTVLNAAGVRLYEYVQGIHTDVTTALIASEPDLSTVVNSLGKTIPTAAGLLVGQLPSPPIVPAESKASTGDPKLTAIRAKAAQVEATRLELESIIEQIPESPTTADLQPCAEFTKTKPFRVWPQPMLSINVNDAAPKGLIRVVGGTRPYNFGWIGQSPSGNVNLSQGAAADGSTGQFVIEVTGDPAVAGNTYQLLVEDSDDHSSAILVSFVAGPSSSINPSKPVAEIKLTPDPELEQLQKGLVELGCMPEFRTENGKNKSNIDGYWGKVTESAVAKLKDALDPSISTDPETLFGGQPKDGTAYYTKVSEKVADAKEASITCQ